MEERDTNLNLLKTIEISKLKPYSKHPYKPYTNEKLNELADSIKEQGLIIPIIVLASKMVGCDNITCDVKELSDIESTIIMVDSNMQRETILPSEKAWAYRYKLNAIKKKSGERTDLTSAQVEQRLKNKTSRELISEKSADSAGQIQRYIRLTHLTHPLLDKVDEKKLAFIPAVELSYLSLQEQEWLYDILSREENFSVPLKLTTKLKGISQGGILTYDKIDRIIITKNHEPPKAIKVNYTAIKDYFPPDTSPKEYEITIKKALEEYFKNHNIELKQKENLLKNEKLLRKN